MGFLAFLFGIFFVLFMGCLLGCIIIYLIHMFSSISGNYDWGTFDEMLNKIVKLNKEHSRTRSIIKGYSYKNIHFQYNESQSLSYDYGWNDFFVCEKHNAYMVKKTDNCGIYTEKTYIVFNPVEYFKYLKWYYTQIVGSKRKNGVWKE